jgi:Ca2+-binding EF-hand superfamily protein
MQEAGSIFGMVGWLKCGNRPDHCRQGAFRHFDADRSGTISGDELRNALDQVHLSCFLLHSRKALEFPR